MLSVAVSEAGEVPKREVPSIAAGAASPGSIEVTLAKAEVRIAGVVDAAALRVVLECLLG
jgi:hypothetical protein